jgi:hypothetical protein
MKTSCQPVIAGIAATGLMAILVSGAFAMLFGANWSEAQSNSGPVRLAIVGGGERPTAAADLLTVELTKRADVQLLERNEIEKVYREQALAAANRDYVKLGQVLGADGLLLVEVMPQGTSQFLVARLVATKPGVIISEVRLPYVPEEAARLAVLTAENLGACFAKLRVPASQVIPMSVVNLRSALHSAQGQEVEQQLTLLTIDRLIHQPELFVLERRQMESLTREKELSANESPFWSGRYVLDGVIDRDGYQRETLTLNARLTPPKGGTAMTIDVAGSRTNLAEVVNRLATRVIELLRLRPSEVSWGSADEADRFFEEAKWGFKWGVLQEAQSAVESSWALGKQTKEVALLRIQIYRSQGRPPQNDAAAIRPERPEYSPDAKELEPALRALSLFEEDFRSLETQASTVDTNWYVAAIDALQSASELLRQFYYHPEAVQGHEEQVQELRRNARETFSLLDKDSRYRGLSPKHDFFMWSEDGLRLEDHPSLSEVALGLGGYWQETPEECLEMYRQYARSDMLHQLRRYFVLPTLIAWRQEQQQRIPELWKGLVGELCESTNALIKLEGVFMLVAEARTDAEYEQSASQLHLLVLDNALAIDAAGWTDRLAQDIGDLVAATRYGVPKDWALRQDISRLFSGLRSDIQKEVSQEKRRVSVELFRQYLVTNADFQPRELQQRRLGNITEDEWKQLRPALAEYKACWLGQAMPEGDLFKYFAMTNLIAELERESGSGSQSSQYSAQVPQRRAWPPPAPAASSGPAPGKPLPVTRFWSVPRSIFESEDILPGYPLTTMATGCFREGRLWLEVRAGDPLGTHKATIWSVNLDTSDMGLIDVNSEGASLQTDQVTLNWYNHGMEMVNGFIYYALSGQVKRYSLRLRSWESVPLPVAGATSFSRLGDRLFASTADSIMEILPADEGVRILASRRRNPPVTLLDSLDNYGRCPVFAGPDGSLRVQVGGTIYTQATNSNEWTASPSLSGLPPPGAFLVFDQGVVFSIRNPLQAARWFRLAWDQTQPEAAFVDSSINPFRPRVVSYMRRSEPEPVERTRWQVPPYAGVQGASFCVDGQHLWIGTGSMQLLADASDRVTLAPHPSGQPLLFDCMEDSEKPVEIPLLLQVPIGVLPKEFLSRFGAPYRTARPPNEQKVLGEALPQSGTTENTRVYEASQLYLLAVPQGLVVTSKRMPGFWLVPREELRKRERSSGGNDRGERAAQQPRASGNQTP